MDRPLPEEGRGVLKSAWSCPWRPSTVKLTAPVGRTTMSSVPKVSPSKEAYTAAIRSRALALRALMSLAEMGCPSSSW